MMWGTKTIEGGMVEAAAAAAAAVGGLLRFEKNLFWKIKKIKIFNKAFLCIYPAN